jgi:hypothetical protein
MARNSRKMAIYESQMFIFFSYKIEKKGNKKNMFYLVVVDPIKVQSRLAPQNVNQNLSFVKDINVVWERPSMTSDINVIQDNPKNRTL